MLRIYVMDVNIVEQAPLMDFQRKAATKKSVVAVGCVWEMIIK